MAAQLDVRASSWAAVSTRRLWLKPLVLLVLWSLQPAESTPGNSELLDRLEMPPTASGGVKSPSEELRQRVAALCRLFAADEDWWDGVEVDVPWAAVCDAMDNREDTWLGVITDCDTADDVLDSTFTIEHEEDDETVVFVDGRELAGLVGFGKHDALCLIAEIDAEVEAEQRRVTGAPTGPKPRGRPKGSKNKPKDAAAAAAAAADAKGKKKKRVSFGEQLDDS
uniref:Uncharacterized protein n=1 Tax=Haptolina ericina TaxID=156174 RepID=A0A7S3APY8_9EUKA